GIPPDRPYTIAWNGVEGNAIRYAFTPVGMSCMPPDSKVVGGTRRPLEGEAPYERHFTNPRTRIHPPMLSRSGAIASPPVRSRILRSGPAPVRDAGLPPRGCGGGGGHSLRGRLPPCGESGVGEIPVC